MGDGLAPSTNVLQLSLSPSDCQFQALSEPDSQDLVKVRGTENVLPGPPPTPRCRERGSKQTCTPPGGANRGETFLGGLH